MSQLLRRTATVPQNLALRPVAQHLLKTKTNVRLFSYTERLAGREWRNGTSKDYIYKPKGLTEPQWDKLQCMMKWRSLAFKEYFASIFGSSHPMMARRSTYDWIKATPTRQDRDDIKAKELADLIQDVESKMKELETYAQKYFERCSVEDAKAVMQHLMEGTGKHFEMGEHVEGDPVLEAQLKVKVIAFVDKMFKNTKIAEETGKPYIEPRFEADSNLFEQSRQRYGTAWKTPEEQAAYKKKYAHLLPPEKEAKKQEDRVYDPISQKMVPAFRQAVDDPVPPRPDQPVEGEEQKTKTPKDEGEGEEDKVRDHDMRPFSQHQDDVLRIERMKKIIESWTNRKSQISSADHPAKPTEAEKDAIQRPTLMQFDRTNETVGSTPGEFGEGKEGGVNANLGVVGGRMADESSNGEKELNDLAREETNLKTPHDTEGSLSSSVNPVPCAVSSESAPAGVDAAHSENDSGSTSIPSPIAQFANKISEISKALETLSPTTRDPASMSGLADEAPKSVKDFSNKVEELKRSLESLGPALEAADVESTPPDPEAPKSLPSPAARLQSSLERLAEMKSRHEIERSWTHDGDVIEKEKVDSENSERVQEGGADDIGESVKAEVKETSTEIVDESRASESKSQISPDQDGRRELGADAQSSSEPSPHTQDGSAEALVASAEAEEMEAKDENIYTILTYDSGSNTMITLTPLSLPNYENTSISVTDALDALTHPEEFIPLLPEGYEVVFSEGNLMILRKKEDVKGVAEESEEREEEVEGTLVGRKGERASVNPVDGTTVPWREPAVANFASPTGFVNYTPLFNADERASGSESGSRAGEKGSENEQDAEKKWSGDARGQRWRSCGKDRSGRSGKRSHDYGYQYEHERGRSRGGKGGAAAVAKTAIWGVTACYIAGVVGEVVEPRR